jgi:hypothetical protein
MRPTADSRACPARCGREKRGADLLCRRRWYSMPDDPKQAYLDARDAVKASKSRSAIDAPMDTKSNILESGAPKGDPHADQQT